MFFVALGVLYYIPEHHVKSLLTAIADTVPSSLLLFDACSQTGLQIANKRVIRDSGMSEDAKLVWAPEDPREIERWDKRIVLLESYPLFRGVKRGRSIKQKWGMFLSDTLGVMSMVHLRIGANV